ncbi:MAG: hypothetical protein ABL921_15495 [Pirellula sp.]
MKNYSPAMSVKQRDKSENVLWVSVIATMGLCLWLSNLLPIQRVEYELTTNLAISQHRLPLLERLMLNGGEATKSASPSFTISSLKQVESDQNFNTHSELISVRIGVRIVHRVPVEEIEACLDRLTTPNAESAELSRIASELRTAKWILESHKHSLKRLELDDERDRQSYGLAGENTDVNLRQPSANGPFRVASFSFRNPRDAQGELRDQLNKMVDASGERVESTQLTLERLKAHARGFLSFTGSPQIVPIAHAITLGRYMALCVLCLLVWFLVIYWMSPIQRIVRLAWKRTKESTASSGDVSAMSELESRIVSWLSSNGIPYLGSVEMKLGMDSKSGERSELSIATQEDHPGTPVQGGTVRASNRGSACQWMRFAGDRILLMWIFVFVVRLIFDPLWRDLVSAAPLAAISRLILGVR